MYMAHRTCGRMADRVEAAAVPLVAPLGGIDTRLVAAVQARAGARTHEAAGLLNGYYLWATILADDGPQHSDRLNGDAQRQFTAARVRLRQFLSGSRPITTM